MQATINRAHRGISRLRERQGFSEQAWSACWMGVVSASSKRYGTGARQDAVEISASGWDDGNQDKPNVVLSAGVAGERCAFGSFGTGWRSRRPVLPRNAVRSPTMHLLRRRFLPQGSRSARWRMLGESPRDACQYQYRAVLCGDVAAGLALHLSGSRHLRDRSRTSTRRLRVFAGCRAVGRARPVFTDPGTLAGSQQRAITALSKSCMT